MRLRVFCLLALLFTSTLHAQEPFPGEGEMTAEEVAQMQAGEQAMASYYARAATALAASGGARDLAFAATLLQFARQAPPQDVAMAGDTPSQPSPRDPRVGEWRGLASARAGKDVLANTLLLQADSADDGSIRQQAAGRWQQLEPDNLAPRLFAKGAVEAWLPETRTQARFDLHYYEQLRWMQSALQAHPPGADEAAALANGEDVPWEGASTILASSILAAVAIPQLQPLFKACQGDALSSTSTRREDCRRVANVMADASDTSLGRSIGITLLQSTAATPEQRADADARRLRFDWQMRQWGRVAAAQPLGGATQFARLLRDPAVRSEQDLIERVLGEAGVALDPPAGWQPPRR